MRLLLPRVNYEGREKNRTLVLNELCDQAELLIRERRRLIAELEAMEEIVGDEYKDPVQYNSYAHMQFG